VNPLTLRHRQMQIAVSRRGLLHLVTLWPAFDPTRIDESWALLQTAAMLIIGQGRTQSSVLAQTYYETIRAAEGVTTALPKVALPLEGWQAAATTSLLVTGAIGAKAAILAKQPLADITANTLVRVSGAVSRIVLNGGRETIGAYVRADRVRWRRITSAAPCPFCAMLAGRGAVYSQDSVNFEAHDHCSCTSEPVFVAATGAPVRRFRG